MRSFLLAVLPLAAFAQTPDIINTYAGGGPNNVPATSAPAPFAVNTAVDSAGNFYYVTGHNGYTITGNRVYEVNTSGTLTVVAGTGFSGYGGGDRAATAALNGPGAVAVDSSGNLYITDGGNCLIRKVTKSTGVISTVAGTPVFCGYSGDGDAATEARLDNPVGIALDSSGNVYIGDKFNQRIRKVTASTGKISTIAGNGTAGYSGDGGAATSAELNDPSSIALDGSGNVYIADTGNCRIRKITTSTGKISTVAGDGTCAFGGNGTATGSHISHVAGLAVDSSANIFIADVGNCVIQEVSGGKIKVVVGEGLNCSYSGDGGPATSAALNNPAGVAVNSSDTMFIADYDNFRIRKAVLGGDISTVAGNGTGIPDVPATTATGAMFDYPNGAVPDASGSVYIADTDNCLIWRATASGAISIFAGTLPSPGNGYRLCGYSGDGGPATSAQLKYPTKAVPDSAGNVYIADSNNCVVRKVNTSGVITTFAGNGRCGYSGDGGAATGAQLNDPQGIGFDSSGNLYIADTENQVIREVSAKTDIITTVAGNHAKGHGYSGDGGRATNAQLTSPLDVAAAYGNFYIADSGNNRIRVVCGEGIIDTFAGNGKVDYAGSGVPATEGSLYDPSGVAVDVAGDLLIADQGYSRIAWVDGAGIIYTVVGLGEDGFLGDGGPATRAQLAFPSGVGVDPSGKIYIADSYNFRIRSVSAFANLNASAYSLPFGSQNAGTSTTKPFFLRSVGPLEIKSISITSRDGDFAQKNNCPSTLASGASCEVTVTFKPSSTGSKTGTVTVQTNGFYNPTVTIQLSGAGD